MANGFLMGNGLMYDGPFPKEQYFALCAERGILSNNFGRLLEEYFSDHKHLGELKEVSHRIREINYILGNLTSQEYNNA